MARAGVGIGRAESEEHAKERRRNREMGHGRPETHAKQGREIEPQSPGFGKTRRGVSIGLSPRQYSLRYADGVRSGGGRKERVERGESRRRQTARRRIRRSGDQRDSSE